MTNLRTRRALLAAVFVTVVSVGGHAPAAEQLKGPLPDDPKLPSIPDANEVTVSADEWADIQKGEIIVQIVEKSSEDRQARAVGYLRHNPAQLFDVATDSSLAPRLVPEVEKVEVLERSPSHKRFYGEANFSMMLPRFEYWMVSAYDDSHTGQAWAQKKGDLDKNEGSHAFLWDPQRQQTLVVFTYDMALKGILSIVPEWVVIRIASRTLPDFLRNLDDVIDVLYKEDPARAERVAGDWTTLKARLDAGELPKRVWKGPMLGSAAPRPEAKPPEPSASPAPEPAAPAASTPEPTKAPDPAPAP